MLVQDVIVETRITDSETCKLPCVAIRISTAFNCSLNQTILEKFLIEKLSMPTKISNQVAYFCSNLGVIVLN